MVSPKMFSEEVKQKRNLKVYIIKNKNTNEIFETPVSPTHFFDVRSAEYTIDFMQLPRSEYLVLESEYNPNENTYE